MSLECETTRYSVLENIFKSVDFDYIFSDNLTDNIENKLTIESINELNSNLLVLGIGFDRLKYTKITQSPKTTLYGLVSSIGGSSGVFLELSFLSIFRAIEFLLGIIFVF